MDFSMSLLFSSCVYYTHIPMPSLYTCTQVSVWCTSDHRGRDRGGEDSSSGDAVQIMEPFSGGAMEEAAETIAGFYEEKAGGYRYRCV